ncbi:TonB-dependent receptor plug domain-containing protein [Endozoicomonas atrinae]|uniref:TonB-dependent receptor plug domain-containing protein n=1 Tax=Endozoicomonas atrinae TaxID=1333660 RepID=UPI0008245954|nr:TonB-dependent receptor [Endozoicomonas atrinae]
MKPSNHSLLLAGIFSSLIAPVSLKADPDLEIAEDGLLDLSLEELISLDVPDVTSVSKRKQRLMDSPAAVFVITNEDIQRSGVTSIPEALRMVPGMQVARLNGNTWSISTRGFNYIFANKLLVLIDGRTVYSPLFSGVNWDVQDTMLEDIARIEVIRGPGAALWGANAVNGVINIITKHAADTQGGLLSTGFGSEEKAFAAYRYGGTLGDDGYYRAFYKTFTRNGLTNSDGTDANDDWKINRAGLRADWRTETGAEASIQSEVYDGTTRPPLKLFDYGNNERHTIVDLNRDQQGGHLTGNYKQYYSDGSNFSFKGYYDRYENYDYRVTEKRDIGDLEFQHQILPWKNHDIIWGLGYRLTKYNLSNMNNITLPESNRTDELYSAFIQDHITITPDWSVSLSSRFEHNDFTGYEIQPNAKLTWKVAENRTFWGSVSRAVKTPSISETSVITRGMNFLTEDMIQPPLSNDLDSQKYLMSISGNEDLDSEELMTFELGYRELFNKKFRLDVTAFYNQYKDIIAYVGANGCLEGTTPDFSTGFPLCKVDGSPNSPDLIAEFPTKLANGLNAKTYGLEVVADWQVNDWWKLQANFSALQVDAEAYENELYLKENEILIEELSASNTANIRSSMNLPNQWYLDFWVRYMDNLKNAKVGAYTALDFRVAKKIGKDLELSLTGKNLFDKQRLEFSEIFSGLDATEVQESWYLQLRWQH